MPGTRGKIFLCIEFSLSKDLISIRAVFVFRGIFVFFFICVIQ